MEDQIIFVKSNNLLETFVKKPEMDTIQGKSNTNSAIKYCFDFGYFSLVTPFRFVFEQNSFSYITHTNRFQQVCCIKFTNLEK